MSESRGLSSVDVIDAIRAYRFQFVAEDQLHEALACALADAGIPFEREVRLNERDRPDFLAVGSVAVEVKVNGSAAEVERQLQRYAEHDAITAVVLVTSCARHAAVARELHSKPVLVVPTFLP